MKVEDFETTEDRYGGAYSGSDPVYISKYGTPPWEKELIWSDDGSCASFWYEQKMKPLKERVAWSKEEYEALLRGEEFYSQYTEALEHTRIWKKQEITEDERNDFLAKLNMENHLKTINKNTQLTSGTNNPDVSKYQS